MCKICVFAGTTEGRRLVEFLAGQPVSVTACVATEYGETLLPQAENVTVSAERLTRAQMQSLFSGAQFDLVVDATHPYAAEVTENISAACEASGTAYLRILREEEGTPDDSVFVETMEEAARFLDQTTGKIFLTTGSKELSALAGIRDFSERCYARVLPMEHSLQLCREAGLQPSHIIAMQGPFSEELNAAMLKAVSASWMLTKQSGVTGGFDEKILAAREAGVRTVIIGRPPQRAGVSLNEALKQLCSRFGLSRRASVTVAGIGPGSRSGMTGEVLEAIEKADCLIGARRMLEAVQDFKKPGFSATKPEKIVEFIRENPQYQTFAVLMSGDSGFYSGTKNLLPLLQGGSVRVLPGISSLSCLCARLGISYEDITPVSLHGRTGNIAAELRRHGRMFVLVGGENGLGNLCRELVQKGLGSTWVGAGERLGYEDEKISCGSAETLSRQQFDSLSAAVLFRDGPGGIVTPGLPDSWFERNSGEAVPVPMTKSEVRAVCLSKLQLRQDSVCWDVGAGTGSVSVEMALQAPRGQVYAIEKKAAALPLLEENREKFACGNLTVIPGTAPEALEALPAPTHVFIGGSSGNLVEIMAAALRKNPKVRIVATAIALETIAELTACMKNFDCAEMVSLSVARDRRAGHYHLMAGLNPICIFTLQAGGEQA